MTPPTEPYDRRGDWYVQRVSEHAERRLRSYTAFSAFPDNSPGEYEEDVDVRALGPAPARRIANDVLAKTCEPGLTVRRLVYRPDGFLF